MTKNRNGGMLRLNALRHDDDDDDDVLAKIFNIDLQCVTTHGKVQYFPCATHSVPLAEPD